MLIIQIMQIIQIVERFNQFVLGLYMAIIRTNFSVDPRITRELYGVARGERYTNSARLFTPGKSRVGIPRSHLLQVRSKIYVCKFRSKIFINKKPSKRSATIFVKVLQNNKIFYYFASMYFTTGDIRVSSKLFRHVV